MIERILISITLLIVISLSVNGITIEHLNHPPEQIKGGVVPFYAIVTFTGQGGETIKLKVTKPDRTITAQNLYPTNNPDEYALNYFDTYAPGNYTYTITATKGGDNDTRTGTFSIADFSLSNVDFVKLVDYVSRVDNVKTLDNPPASLDLMGTEYLPGDLATIFLQLKDQQGNPVNNGTCYLVLDDAPMLNDNTDTNGLYYYDITAPETEGNYMLSATCSYSYQSPIYLYGPLNPQSPNETRRSEGVWVGDTSVLNDRTDGLYTKCTSTSSTDGCHTHYTYAFPTGDYQDNSTIQIFYSGQATRDRTTKFACLNQSNTLQEISLTNQLTYSGHANSDHTTNIDDFLTNILPESCIDRSLPEPEVTVAFSIDDQGIIVYHNWLTITILPTGGNVQDLKGSSEMHITNIPGGIWEHLNRTLTDYHEPQISEYVWNHTSRELTYYPSATVNNTEIAEFVWSYDSRELTFIPTVNATIFDSLRPQMTIG